jgi:predicted DNA-binding WGR domain protein
LGAIGRITMPRYEYIEGNSSKFWEIELEGTSFTTTYGRIGTSGQTSLKEYDSEEKAKKESDKLIAEKVKKGYVLVGATGPGVEPKTAQEETKAAESETKAAKAVKLEAKPTKVVKSETKPAKAKPKPKAGKTEDEQDEADDPEAEELDDNPRVQSSQGSGSTRYFEFVDAGSGKFWEIALDGTSFTTRYGKIGTNGQQSLKEYDSEDRAQSEYDKLVAEKVKKGYVEK